MLRTAFAGAVALVLLLTSPSPAAGPDMTGVCATPENGRDALVQWRPGIRLTWLRDVPGRAFVQAYNAIPPGSPLYADAALVGEASGLGGVMILFFRGGCFVRLAVVDEDWFLGALGRGH